MSINLYAIRRTDDDPTLSIRLYRTLFDEMERHGVYDIINEDVPDDEYPVCTPERIAQALTILEGNPTPPSEDPNIARYWDHFVVFLRDSAERGFVCDW